MFGDGMTEKSSNNQCILVICTASLHTLGPVLQYTDTAKFYFPAQDR